VSLLAIYRPNFCAQCGERIIRLRWSLWTSRSFCDACFPEFRKQRWLSPLLRIGAFLCLGLVTGRALRSKPAPLIIERNATVPSSSQQAADKSSDSIKTADAHGGSATETKRVAGEEEVYLCGARTKKGTPCSRRVHGPVRCWQHKGMPAMLPPDKLIIKN
jgi:hypothetical protein